MVVIKEYFNQSGCMLLITLIYFKRRKFQNCVSIIKGGSYVYSTINNDGLKVLKVHLGFYELSTKYG